MMMQLAKPSLVSALSANTVIQSRRAINIENNQSAIVYASREHQLRRPLNISNPGLRCIMKVPLSHQQIRLFANTIIRIELHNIGSAFP